MQGQYILKFFFRYEKPLTIYFREYENMINISLFQDTMTINRNDLTFIETDISIYFNANLKYFCSEINKKIIDSKNEAKLKINS